MLSHVIQFSISRPKRVIVLWAVLMLTLGSIGAGFGYRVYTDDRRSTSRETSSGSKRARGRFRCW